MLKYLTAGALACLTIFLFSGCSNHGDELPTDVQSVGGVITKDNELLEQSDAEYTQGLPYGGDTGLGLNEFCLTGLDVDYATTDNVKSWLAEYVSGEYTQSQDPEVDGVVRENAGLAAGGRIDIVTMSDVYYMTELRLDSSKTADELEAQISDIISAYIGRRLATSEVDELSNAVSSAMGGSGMSYVPALSNTAEVYLMMDEGDLLVQIR